MKLFCVNSINDIYKEVGTCLLHEGSIVKARTLETKELLNVIIELTSPYDRFITLKNRNLNMKYFVGEFCFYMSGSNKLDFISYYSKFWEKVSDDSITVNSAYGKRIFFDLNKTHLTQMNNAYIQLIRDKNTRKAVIQLATPDDSKNSKDNICTIYLHFFIRDNKLILKTQMRSNDIWLGVPYDIAFFTLIQEMMHVSLLEKYPTLECGSYYHSVDSLHIYNNHYTDLFKCVNETASKLIAPLITLKDIRSGFKYAIAYEYLKRLNISQYKKIVNGYINYKTNFQNWLASYL